MKVRLFLMLCLVASATYGQRPYYPTEKFTEQDTAYKFHRVKGERSGPSFFKKQRFK